MTQRTCWHLAMFGGLCARQEDAEPIVLSRQQTGTLFAYLALHLDTAHSRESLAARIWPEDTPEDAGHKFRQSLYALRRQFGKRSTDAGDIFVSTRTTIQLDPSLFSTDVLQFEQSIAAASAAAGIEEKTRSLQVAVELYRGDLLPGFYLEAFEPTRRYLAEQYRLALQKLAKCHEDSGDLKQAIEICNRVVTLDPLIEESHCQLMRLYASDGQPAAVIRQYQALESALRLELNASPPESTTRLMESLRILAQTNAASSGDLPIALGAANASPKPAAITGDVRRIDHAPSDPISRKRFQPIYSLAMIAPVVCVLLALQTMGVYPGHSSSSRGGPAVASAPDQTTIALKQAALGNLGKVPTDARPVLPDKSAPNLPDHTPADSSAAKRAITARDNRMTTAPRAGADVAPMPGTMLWNVRYKLHPGDKTSEALAVATDAQHNIYVTGIVDTAARDVDFLTVKFDAQGHQLWEDRYDGPGHDMDRPIAIAVDNLGGVYVTGESDNGKQSGPRFSGLDFATIKYDASTGKRVWVNRYNGLADGQDSPTCMKVNSTGVYVLGKSWGFGKTGRDGFQYALVKYSLAGERQWECRYDGGAGDDEPADMVLAPDGGVYVTGVSLERPIAGVETDIVALKISKDGKIIKEDRYGFENHMNDSPCKIGLDRSGNIYVVGNGRSPKQTPDRLNGGCITLKYDANLEVLRVLGTSAENDRIETASTAFVSETGDLAIAGIAHDQNGTPMARIVCRDANGLVRWNHDLCSLAG